MTWFTVIKAIFTILPLIVQLVRDGRIVRAGQLEVITALKEKVDERIVRAERARSEPHDNRVPDPYDRAHRE